MGISKYFPEDLVYIGKFLNYQYAIEINDFFDAVYYVLTNTDLYKNDPRLKFIGRVKKMKKVKGYTEGNKHFE
jgi:hypothetical protein